VLAFLHGYSSGHIRGEICGIKAAIQRKDTSGYGQLLKQKALATAAFKPWHKFAVSLVEALNVALSKSI
jgi:hypothetical protein